MESSRLHVKRISGDGLECPSSRFSWVDGVDRLVVMLDSALMSGWLPPVTCGGHPAVPSHVTIFSP